MITPDMRNGNISSTFEHDEAGEKMARELIKRSDAIRYFAANCDDLPDYHYWLLLSTLWVDNTEYADLALWKALFSSDRPGRDRSIMKPNELRAYNALRDREVVYRAHREGEDDWIAYTLSLKVAKRFRQRHQNATIRKYIVDKSDVLALFLRRGESEIIVLNKNTAQEMIFSGRENT